MSHPTLSPLARGLPARFSAVLVASLVLASGHAQTAAPARADTPAGGVTTLSRFEVKSERDTSYAVENTVATTGIAQSLTQTPLSISVVTDQFLRDSGRSGFREALAFTGSLTFDNNAGDGRNQPGLGLSQPNFTRSRGQALGTTQRNGLSLGIDTDNVDRIEVARGPMAVFIGGSNLGGVVNVITKKPMFSRLGDVYVRFDENEHLSATLDLTGPLSRTLAYRLTTAFSDGPTWREFSDSQKRYVDAQLTWRPTQNYQSRLEVVDRTVKGNLVAYNVSSSQNYQNDYDNPSQALLDLGRRRTTGAAAGRPFTRAEYQARIGRAFASWRQDVYDATGVWRSLGEGEFITPGLFPAGVRANSYGPNSPYTDEQRFVETEHNWHASDWLDLHFVGRAADTAASQLNYAFNPRTYPDGSTPLLFGNSARRESDSLDAKIEGVITQQWGGINATLLVGEQVRSGTTTLETGAWDPSRLAPVPGSPFVAGSPAILNGRAVYDYFDPRVHAYPDHRVAQRWATDVNPVGMASVDRSRNRQLATYVAGGLSFMNGRLTLTGGLRRLQDRNKSARLDRNDTQVGDAAFGRDSTGSHMYGFSLRTLPGVYLYGSYNQGSTAAGGSTVGRYNSLAPADIVSLQEASAHPSPNLIGKGKELGIKFELVNRKLTGSIGWFELVNSNILVTDTAKTAADSRNIGTEVDPNSATVNSAIQPRVRWSSPVDGDISAGIEAELVWAPVSEFNLIFSTTHLSKNRITVNPPVSTNPLTLRDYLLLNGRRLNNTPDTMVRVWGHYKFRQGALRGWALGTGIRHQTESMPGSGTDLNWGLINPGFTVTDVTLSYETKLMEQAVTYQLFINNVTDRLYSDGGRSYSPPREIAAAVRLQF